MSYQGEYYFAAERVWNSICQEMDSFKMRKGLPTRNSIPRDATRVRMYVILLWTREQLEQLSYKMMRKFSLCNANYNYDIN
jgi:hypothetical protein